MEISDKLLAYIHHKSDLSQEIIDKYVNSLIFIGDEQQIYQPLTNTYVGIGKSEFDRILSFSSITQVIPTNENVNLYMNFSYNNSFGFTYVDEQLKYNPYLNTLTTSYFVGTLHGNALSANRLAYDTSYTIWGQSFFADGRPKNASGNMTVNGNITKTKNITPTTTYLYTLGSTSLWYSYTYSASFIGNLYGLATNAINSLESEYSNYSYTSRIISTNGNTDLFITFAYNNNYSYSYVDEQLKYNPESNTLTTSYFVGTLDPALQWGTITGTN